MPKTIKKGGKTTKEKLIPIRQEQQDEVAGQGAQEYISTIYNFNFLFSH